MTRNWLPIVLCLGFILAWQVYVVSPYNKKVQSAQGPVPSQGQVAGANGTPPNGAVPTQPSFAPTPSTNPALNSATRTQVAAVPLSKSRSVSVYQNGGIGAAVFRDYKVRGKSNDDVVTLILDGFAWTSSDPQVNQCLASMAASTNASENVQFVGSAGNGKCVLQYLNGNQTGLLHTSLKLSGFAAGAGFLEFRGIDAIGEGLVGDHNSLIYKVDGSRKTIREKSLLESKTVQGKVDWLAWGDKYFTAILIPRGAFNPNVVYGTSGYGPKKISFGFQYPLATDNAAKSYDFDMYFGTRDTDELFRIDPTLIETVDMGWFGAIARVMLAALKGLNKLFHNFGLSIIALTLLVRLAFWPLNKKVFKSGQAMKALQPEVEKIRAKYGNDKSKAGQMNTELMGLYKTYKVNPLGSCLPLLLQMPIFLGLYGALNHSLDLYQAPFFGWIHDLSSPDRFYVLPVLWTATLLAYVKLNPTAPTQPGAPDMKWIMAAMNLFFGFLAKDWPAGLTLYLFVSNLVGISQQFFFQRAASKLQPIQEGA